MRSTPSRKTAGIVAHLVPSFFGAKPHRAPDLDLLRRAYVRRFDLEHTLRFCKQCLDWTTPRIRHPEQADRWTWRVVTD
jgi:hypothetical protein